MAVVVVRDPVPHIDIHLFAFSGFVHTLVEHENVPFIVYAACQLSFYERCNAVFGKIGRFVFTSGERLGKLRIWEHSS